MEENAPRRRSLALRKEPYTMRFSTTLLLAVTVALTACNGATTSLPSGASGAANASHTVQHPTAAQLGLWPKPGPAVHVCGTVGKGYARCLALVRTDIKGMARPDTPSGYGPSDLQTAYGLTSYSQSNGGGQTVAIVDAYDDPNAASDLNV